MHYYCISLKQLNPVVKSLVLYPKIEKKIYGIQFFSFLRYVYIPIVVIH
jgi:hypothetical protein